MSNDPVLWLVGLSRETVSTVIYFENLFAYFAISYGSLNFTFRVFLAGAEAH